MKGWRAKPFLAAGLAALMSAPWPIAARAEPVETALTLSADADSRLVLAYWPEQGWLVRQSGRLAELALPGAELAIPVETIALPAASGALMALESEVSADRTVLRLGLGCDCTLAVHGDGRRLVIDIVGAGRAAGPLQRDAGPAPRLTRVPPPRVRPGGGASPPSVLDVEETRSRLLAQIREAADAGVVRLRRESDVLLAGLRGTPAIGIAPEAGGTTDRNGHGQRAPGTSVARAAAPVTRVAVAAVGPAALAGSATPADDAPAAAHRAPTASTGEVREGLIARAPAVACIASERFILPDPLPPQAFAREVSRLRRELLGEFDRPQPDAAISLARLYLGHGLGAEALQVLAEFAPAAPEAPLLAALAYLVEGRALPEPNLLDVPGCAGQHALWQALDAALGGRAGAALRLAAAAEGALEQVTRGLRGRIATHLGLAALDAGDWIAAHRLEAMARRSLDAEDRAGREQQRLLAALVLRARGDGATAARELARLRTARSTAGAEAALLLAELAVAGANGREVAPDGLQLDLASLATAHRGKPLGERAFRAEVMATAHLLGRESALGLLRYGRRAGLIGEPGFREMLVKVAARMDGPAGDTPLAALYESDRARFAGLEADGEFRAALARSYLALGAPALAERALRAEDLARGGLRAMVAAGYRSLGDFTGAQRVLGGAASSGSRLSGASGRSMGAVATVAGRLVAGTGAAEGGAARARAAWADGRWDEAVEALRAAASERVVGGLVEGVAATGGGRTGPRRGDAERVEAGRADAKGADAKRADPGRVDPEGADLALRLALAARRAGLAAPPAEALALVAQEPALASGLRAIFAETAAISPEGPAGSLAPALGDVAAEARLYEEVLNGG